MVGARGSIFLYILVGCGLFAALMFALSRMSSAPLSIADKGRTKLAASMSAECSRALDTAVEKLSLKGCSESQISYKTPNGSNANPDAPADGSCDIYSVKGGGVLYSACVAAPAPVPSDPCTTGPIGTVCTADGAFYIGTIGGNRIYAAPADQSGWIQWKTANTDTPGATSTTNGLANTNAMIAAGAAAHPAGNACKTKAPAGTWYLPARNEMNLIWTNRVAIGLAAKGFIDDWYWASTSPQFNQGWYQSLSPPGTNSGYAKIYDLRVRCVRR